MHFFSTHTFLTRIGRLLLLLLLVLIGVFISYFFWQPGTILRSGAHDKGSNGIWLQHGWLGNDSWFENSGKESSPFRSKEQIRKLASLLRSNGVKFLFPHLCPCSPVGEIPPVDQVQTEQFLSETHDFIVLPWVGGVLNSTVFIESPQWQSAFASSAKTLLLRFPDFKGIHINIEPLPSGNSNFLDFLKLLRRTLPIGAIISIAAYPPPTFLQRWPGGTGQKIQGYK